MTTLEAAEDLVHTSVDETRSALQCARAHGGYPVSVLTMARDLAAGMGQVTRVRVLETELRRMARRRKQGKGAVR